MHGNIEEDIGVCYNFKGTGAKSVRPRESKDTTWPDEIYNGVACRVETYKQRECQPNHFGVVKPLPGIIDGCIAHDDNSPILSIRFVCINLQAPPAVLSPTEPTVKA